MNWDLGASIIWIVHLHELVSFTQSREVPSAAKGRERDCSLREGWLHLQEESYW